MLFIGLELSKKISSNSEALNEVSGDEMLGSLGLAWKYFSTRNT